MIHANTTVQVENISDNELIQFTHTSPNVRTDWRESIKKVIRYHVDGVRLTFQVHPTLWQWLGRQIKKKSRGGLAPEKEEILRRLGY